MGGEDGARQRLTQHPNKGWGGNKAKASASAQCWLHLKSYCGGGGITGGLMAPQSKSAVGYRSPPAFRHR